MSGLMIGTKFSVYFSSLPPPHFSSFWKIDACVLNGSLSLSSFLTSLFFFYLLHSHALLYLHPLSRDGLRAKPVVIGHQPPFSSGDNDNIKTLCNLWNFSFGSSLSFLKKTPRSETVAQIVKSQHACKKNYNTVSMITGNIKWFTGSQKD